METELEEIRVTTQPLPTNKQVDSRDFRVESISLISSQGVTVDITAMVMELQLRQDIYLGFMSAEIMIQDAIGLYSDVKFHGNEYVYFQIREPEQKLLIKKAFRVYKISNRDNIQNSAQRYIIYLVSDEMVLSQNSRISKAYKNQPISSIVKDVLKTYLKIPDKRIKVDETTIPFDIVIPNKRPLEALNWLTSRAYTNEDSAYFFYENLDGFNFRAIQSLYKEAPPISEAYVFQNKSIEKSLKSDKFSIDSVTGMKEFDVLSGISSGMYTMGLLGLDPYYRTYTTTKYNLNTNKSLYTNKPPSSSDPLLLKEDSTAHYLTYLDRAATSSEKQMGTREWVKRIMSLAALNNTLTELVLPGSIRVQVGKLIEIVYPKAVTPNDSQDQVDKLRSGLYLVVAVNHKIDMLNQRYQTICMVARDSQPESLPASDTTLPDKIRKLNNG
jgi:hypothetical protein